MTAPVDSVGEHAASSAGGVATAIHPAARPPEDSAAQESYRAREEMSALIIGFGTGISIALVFLLYIALDAAKLLP